VFVACVFVSVAGFINVAADNHDVIQLAREVACGAEGASCNAQMTRMERTPIAQTFEIATPKRRVDVRCTRQLVLVGSYRCALR
jgi:hypothetical protein